nr:MAG: cytochrome c class I [Bacteroidota bacterium]
MGSQRPCSKTFQTMSTGKSVLGVVLLGAAAMFCLSFEQSPSSQEGKWVAPAWTDTLKNPFVGNAAAIERGKESYDLYCWSCHGKKGRGDGAAGASFPIPPADLHAPEVRGQTDGALYWKLTTGRGNMTPYGDLLTEEQRWELVAYIRVLSNDEGE